MTNPGKPRQVVAAVVVAVCAAAALFVAGHVWLRDTKVLTDWSWLNWAVFVALTLGGIPLIASLPEPHPKARGAGWNRTARRVARWLGMPLLWVWLSANLAFVGVTAIRHLLGAAPGAVVVTVLDKHRISARSQIPFASCRFQLGVREFRSFPANRSLCVGRDLYHSARVGDRLRITGTVSDVAVRASQVQLVGLDWQAAPADTAPLLARLDAAGTPRWRQIHTLELLLVARALRAAGEDAQAEQAFAAAADNFAALARAFPTEGSLLHDTLLALEGLWQIQADPLGDGPDARLRERTVASARAAIAAPLAWSLTEALGRTLFRLAALAGEDGDLALAGRLEALGAGVVERESAAQSDADVRWDAMVAADRRIEGLRAAGDLDSALAAAERNIADMRAWQHAAPLEPRATQALATALILAGEVQQQLGRRDAARAHYAEALTLRRALADAAPGDVERRRSLAVALSRLADTGAQPHDPERLGRLRRQVVDIRRQLAEETPDDLQRAFGLAVALERLGDHLLDEAPRAALASYREELAIAERRHAALPDDPEVSFALGWAHERVGRAQLRLGQHAAALTAFDSGLETAQALLARYPDEPRFANLVGYLLRQRGLAQWHLQRLGAARRSLAASAERYHALVDARPATVQWRLNLSAVLHDLGRIPGLAPAESRVYLEQAQALLTALKRAGVLPDHKQRTLAQIEQQLARLGD